ncbi:hypothetical protein R1sor_018200 [Riccia sorocarpa]|uniref:DNA-directed RNA polymerase III subunit RPC5 n=1 Tax=Riccia sorocarpa TaxID=122646 RepID=A0ABD3I907_9MARC
MGSNNGEAKMASGKSGDIKMADPDSGSAFLLSQSKMDIFDTVASTSAPASAKPRFEPKVKPRGSQTRGSQAKSRLSAQSKVSAQPVDVKAPDSAEPRVSLNSGAKLPAADGPGAREHSNTDHTAVKSEPALVKVKEEPQLMADISNRDMKVEPGIGEVNPQLPKEEAAEDMKVDSGLRASHPELLKDEATEDMRVDSGVVKTHQGVTDDEVMEDVEPGVDRVVREIDVFVSRSIDPDTQLYLLQYPLRPAWRPYGLEEQCLEVRVKAAQKKVELDLAIDGNSENYDQEAAEHLRITKQTLTSSKIPLSTSYAIGLMQGNKLYLNPVQAVVQMRPSMKYLDEGDTQKKKQASTSNEDGDEEMTEAATNAEASAELVALQVNVRRRETEWQEENRLQSHAYLKQLDEAEPWIALEPHGVDSPVTDAIRTKMIASAPTQIPFKLGPSDYIKQLVPGQATVSPSQLPPGDMSGSAGFSRSFLNTLPLEKRFHLLLSKGRVHVLPFERLMKLAPEDCTEEEVLNVLQEKAVLVQGCWVAASNLRYHKPVTIVRDYLLSLFTKSRVVEHSQLEELRIPKDILREILSSFAVQRGVTQSWEFQESTDRSFIKRHQTVVKEQAQRWAEVEPHLRETVRALELTGSKVAGKTSIDLSTVKELNATKAKLHIGELKKPVSAPEKTKGVHFSLSGDESGSSKANGIEGSGHTTLSEASLAALPGALLRIFRKHSVCRLQLICQSLRAMAIVTADSSKDSLAVEEAKAAAQAASAPLPELEAAMSKVASNIDGVYFLTSLGDKELDPFRNVVIALLRAKGPTSGLRKTDIMEAAKIALKTDIRPQVYQKVLKELCYTKGGAWVLKPGDGRPS